MRRYEVIGVVSDVEYPDSDVPPEMVYSPLTTGANYPVTLVVRVPDRTGMAGAELLRRVAREVDTSVRLDDVMSLGEALQVEQRIFRAGALVPILVTLSVLLLAAAGIYALMSFAVTQRRREIGVRAALGARPGRLLWSIFSRAVRQLMVGVAVGLTLVLLGTAIGGRLLGVPTFQTVALVLGACAFMTLVGLAATLGPARRGLRIQPTEALREA